MNPVNSVLFFNKYKYILSNYWLCTPTHLSEPETLTDLEKMVLKYVRITAFFKERTKVVIPHETRQQIEQ